MGTMTALGLDSRLLDTPLKQTPHRTATDERTIRSIRAEKYLSQVTLRTTALQVIQQRVPHRHHQRKMRFDASLRVPYSYAFFSPIDIFKTKPRDFTRSY